MVCPLFHGGFADGIRDTRRQYPYCGHLPEQIASVAAYAGDTLPAYRRSGRCGVQTAIRCQETSG
jgi:hypothetical protein